MYEAALTLSLICLLGVGFFFMRSPAFSVFHPLTFYICFHGLIFVIRPIVAWGMEFRFIYQVYQFTPSASDKLIAILASNLGFLVFAFFAFRAGGVAMQFKQDRFAVAERNRLSRIFPWVAAICIPIGAYSLISLWNDASNDSSYATMMQDAATGVAINTTANGYLVEAQLMLASCGAIVAWIFRFRLIAILPLVAFIIGRAGTGGRGPFVTSMVTVGLLYLYEKRRKLPSFKIFLGILAVVAMFTVVGDDRGRSIRQMVGTDNTASHYYGSNEARFMEGMDFGNLEYFEYLVYVVPQRSHTYDYFIDNLQLFTEPIPRVLWKNKPIGAPFNRIFLMDYGFPVGMTRSLPGEGWFALGWAGVAIWCGLWGYGLGWIYRKYVEGPQGTLHTAAYMIFLPVLIVAYRDGLVVTVFRQCLFFLMPVVLWLALSRALSLPTAQHMRVAAAMRIKQLRRSGAAPDKLATGPANFDPESSKSHQPALLLLPPAVARRRARLSGGAQMQR